jgi:hypothetical protein
MLSGNRPIEVVGSVTLPNRARNKSPGTSGSRSSDYLTPRQHRQAEYGPTVTWTLGLWVLH